MPKKTQPARLTPGCHQPAGPRTGSQPRRAEARYAMNPEIRKQIEPSASGRHTSRSYDGLDKAVCNARKVVALKKSVPADWTVAAHHAARPAPASPRSGAASQTCSAPPVVKSSDPMKKV